MKLDPGYYTFIEIITLHKAKNDTKRMVSCFILYEIHKDGSIDKYCGSLKIKEYVKRNCSYIEPNSIRINKETFKKYLEINFEEIDMTFIQKNFPEFLI